MTKLPASTATISTAIAPLSGWLIDIRSSFCADRVTNARHRSIRSTITIIGVAIRAIMFISMSRRACANISRSGAGTGSNDPSGHHAYDSYSAPSRNIMPPSIQNDAIVSCPNNVPISEVCAPVLGFCICTLLKPATSST
ncbi:hypothetical protein WS62_19280 [Burkholderia sp. ABCPW 14]|nr:hypothetical protein WS62_19280 [Burkholderia sp. ABCPW 14]